MTLVQRRVDVVVLSGITEVDHYKYLGFHISRNLSDHVHVNEMIKKGNRLIGYIKSIINSHDNFNRVYYGNILWKTLALPAINYACAVSSFSASDYKRLENLQRQIQNVQSQGNVHCSL